MFAQQSYFKSNIHRLNLKKFVQHVESLVKKFINTYEYYKLNVFQLFMTMPILWKKIFQLSKKVYGILNKGNQFHQRYHTERKCTTIISTLQQNHVSEIPKLNNGTTLHVALEKGNNSGFSDICQNNIFTENIKNKQKQSTLTQSNCRPCPELLIPSFYHMAHDLRQQYK